MLISRFYCRYKESLTSLSIPIPYGPLTRETLEFLLKVCRLLPGLKGLAMVESNTGRLHQHRTFMDGLEFFKKLTTALASPEYSIESFSIPNLGTSFSPAMGELFTPWSSLKYLRVGDKDNEDSRWAAGRRLDFDGYKCVSTYSKTPLCNPLMIGRISSNSSATSHRH